jgi:hypothetical protein
MACGHLAPLGPLLGPSLLPSESVGTSSQAVEGAAAVVSPAGLPELAGCAAGGGGDLVGGGGSLPGVHGSQEHGLLSPFWGCHMAHAVVDYLVHAFGSLVSPRSGRCRLQRQCVWDVIVLVALPWGAGGGSRGSRLFFLSRLCV